MFAGESTVVAPSGEVLLRLNRNEAVGTARIDTSDIAASRSRYRYLDDRRILAARLPMVPSAGGGEIAFEPVAS
jgi:predicted amidohydrolase